MLHLVLLLVPVFSLTWSLVCLIQNYRNAQRTKLPIIVHPVDGFNVLWMISRQALLPVLDRLPFHLGAFAHRTQIGWNYHDKYGTHERLKSGAFWIVSPGSRELHIADPAAADEVMRGSRTDFIKSPEMYQVLEIFGETVNSVNGKTWERHRRVTAPPFNERISGAVWDEAGRQATAALQVWQTQDVVRSTQPDTAKLALHVLTQAGFGVGYEFDESKASQKLEEGHKLSYRDALRTILTNPLQIVLLRLMQSTGWPAWATWGNLRQVVDAHAEFQSYLEAMIAKERETASDTGKDQTSLMGVLVRSSDQARAAGEKSSDMTSSQGATTGLSDSEVYGNLFMYNLAGHDTTASTMDFALTVLALHPEWQEWIAEEVDQVFSSVEPQNGGEQQALSYEDIFPKLPRCLALMYEILRLYGPVPSLPRWTSDSYRRLTIDGKEVLIPPKSNIIVNFAGLHTHPSHWAPDPLAFRPNRWITTTINQQQADRNSSSSKVNVDDDNNSDHPPYDWQSASLLQPTAGTFVPWNAGPRVCPGKKFAQVEFVRVIATLFSNGSRVKIVREADESEDQARRRIESVIAGAQVGITLRMVRSETVGVRWFTKDRPASL